jgi:hypothetical protein
LPRSATAASPSACCRSWPRAAASWASRTEPNRPWPGTVAGAAGATEATALAKAAATGPSRGRIAADGM